MRLIHSSPQGTFCLTEYPNKDLNVIPRYAILSHTWGADSDEVTFDDIQHGAARDKIGHAKLEFCAEQARKDGIGHFWIDTCCINKASLSELSEAIASMYRWYQNAVKCYVFLADVSSSERDMNGGPGHIWERSFRSSRWFTRGWTLQELLAPLTVEFFSRERLLLGSKATLRQQIHEITGIPTAALRSKSMVNGRSVVNGKSLLDFSIEERFAWAEKRQTTKDEDIAYCLFGIFDVQLPVLYGEGREKAIRRLKKEIGVTPTQIDEVIRKRYDDGRLRIERLSGKSLPLEYCFVNLGIIDHVRDYDRELASAGSDQDEGTGSVSKFSLAARLKVETPPKSRQVSLNTLFRPRKHQDGTRLRPNRILIWGRAGMGKTTLCKKIVHEVCKNGLWKDLYDRVIWLPLRRLKKIESRNTVELLQNEFPCTGLGEQVSKALDKLAQDERTLFLLDGLDEVSFALEQDGTGERILRELLSRSHVIITSRPHSTRVLDDQPPDLELETVGFFSQQIEEYLQLVVNDANVIDTTLEEIRSFIRQRPLVRSLAVIPIQLDAICYTWNSKNFPRDNATMTSLYLTISQSLWKNSALRLGKTENGGDLITRQQLDHWTWRYFKNFVEAEITFLQELAFRGLCEEVIEFSAEDIDMLEAGQQMPGDKIVHLAFLRVSDSSVEADDRTFHFIHLTFQEFFAAQYFVCRWTSNKALPLWERTGCGRLSDQSTGSVTPEEFVQSSKYVDRYDIFWRFVAGLLRTERNKEHLYRFLDTLEHEPIDLIGLAHQRLVVHCLSELGADDNELRWRIQQLEDRYLQWALCELRLNRKWRGKHRPSLIWEAECSDYILERLLNEEETEKEVLKVLRHRPSISSKMLELVMLKLGESTNEDVQIASIQIVGQNCGHDQKEKVLELFRNMQCFRKRPLQIIRACGWTSRLLEPAAETLVGLLQDPDREVRLEAADVLKRQAALPSTTVETLVRLLQHPNRDVRYQAARALGGQTTLPSTTIKTLIRRLQHSNPGVRCIALTALEGQTTLPSTAIQTLIQLLLDPNENIRYQAVNTLKRQATLSGTTIKILIRLLQHPNTNVRCMPVYILGGQATLPSTTIKILIRLLSDPNKGIRTGAMDAIEAQTTLSRLTIDTLVQLLQHPDTNVQSIALCTLGGQTTLPNTVNETFIRLLSDLDPGVRFAVAKTLRQILSNTTIETLVQLLQDPDTNVRYMAVFVLGGQTTLPSTAIETLVWLLQDPDTYVRYQAARALKELSTLSSTTIKALVQLLQDPDTDVRYMAANALGGQTALPSTAIEAFIRLLQHSDAEVRCRAAGALVRQSTLSSTAIKALVRLLQHQQSDELDDIENKHITWYQDMITHCQEIRSLIPAFSSSALQHFVRRWFSAGSEICFIENGCFCIRASERLQRIPLQQHQLEPFRAEWRKAQDALGLPILTPCFRH